MSVNPIPEGYHRVTPYLSVRRASEAIEFYKKVFGAEEKMRMSMPDGTVAHAELQIGDSIVMLADENPEWGNMSPESIGGTASGLMLYVEDVDQTFRRAVEAGAQETMAVEDQFYGDRSGQITDPFGHKWTIATHVEDVSDEEMQRRVEQYTAQGA